MQHGNQFGFAAGHPAFGDKFIDVRAVLPTI